MVAQLAPFFEFNSDIVEKEMKIGIDGTKSAIDPSAE